MKKFIFYLSMVSFYWGADIIFAHPHVFIESSITFVFNEKGLIGLKQKWILDEFFSNSLLIETNKDGDERLNDQEIEAVRAFAFESLKNYQFFTNIKIDGKTIEIKSAKHFFAEIKQKKLIYHFFIECPIHIDQNTTTLLVSIFDKSYYSSIVPAKKPIRFENSDNFLIHHQFEKIKEWAYYNDMLIPEGIILKMKRIK